MKKAKFDRNLGGNKAGARDASSMHNDTRMRRPKGGLDRVVANGWADLSSAIDSLEEFDTIADHARRNVGAPKFNAPYGRARRLVNKKTGTKLFIEYLPRYKRLAPIRFAIVPNDVTGLRHREFDAILRAFTPHRLLIVEFRLDFPDAAMNAEFIRQHMRCGKSRMRPNVRYPDAVWFGVAKSAKFLRCYPKEIYARVSR